MEGEGLKKYLREKGYEYLNTGHSKKGLGQHLSRCHSHYQSNQHQQQSPSNDDQNQRRASSNTSHTTSNTPIMQPIIIEQKSGFDFWDIMLLSCLWGRGGNTTINNYASGTNHSNNQSDDRVLGPCIAAFCLIFATVASYFLLAWAAYKIKNAKLENNKYSVPSAIGLGIFSFSVSATLVLLLSGMIVPNLQRAMGISSGAFTVFQVIIGLNAIIFGLGAVSFFYLAIDKASKKALVDMEVDRMINCNMCSPDDRTSGNQYRGQQFPHQDQPDTSSPQQLFTTGQPYHHPQQSYPSAPPPSYDQSVGGYQYYNQPGTSGYNSGYTSHQNDQFQQGTYFNNPNLTPHNFDQSLPPKY